MSSGVGTSTEPKGIRLTEYRGSMAGGAPPSGTSRGAVLRCLAAALVGFLAGFGRMVGFAGYMNVAAAAAAGSCSWAVLAGSALSCIVSGSFAEQAVQLGAMLAITALNVFFPERPHRHDPIRLSLTVTAICVILSCIVSAGSTDGFLISMRMISSLLCGCVVYAAAYIAERWRSGEPLRVGGLTAVFLAMIYIVTVASLCSCAAGRFNLGRILACAVIPAAAKKRRAAGGAVMGALSAVAVTMCSANLAVNTMLLAAAGLICSAFADLGRVACGAAFMLSAAAALAVSGLNPDTFNMLTDIIAGTAIFAVLPAGTLRRLSARFMIVTSPADCAGQTASARLTFAAMTIADIRQKLERVSETVEENAESRTFGERVTEALCADCRRYEECRSKGCSEVPDPGNCIRADELAEISAACRDREIYERAEALRMREQGELLREQLGIMTDLLNDLSCRLSRRRETDVKLSAAAKSFFERRGFKGVRACVYTDEALGRHVEIYISGEAVEETLSLTAGLCRVLELDLELPGVTDSGGMTKLEFDELPPFTADYGCWSSAGSPDECSGDSIECVGASASERFVLLSDGMGSGRRARLDSEIAVSLAERLLRTGLSMATAQRVINSVMQSYDRDESFATLDFLRLDLFSGRAEFLKSGAAPAYLCRDGNMVRISSDSYPAGIFFSADPDIVSMKVFEGDMLILATDGAPEEALEEAARLCFSKPEMKAEDIARETGRKCRILSSVRLRGDDVTVAVVRISRREKNMHNRRFSALHTPEVR